MARNDLACQQLVELVTDYFDRALSRADRARLEAHVRACDGCTEYIAQMRRTIEVTGRLPPDALDPEATQALLDVFRRWKAG